MPRNPERVISFNRINEEYMDMVAYEFYFRNKIKGDELIGILPERRRKPERVTQESIMKWAKIVFSDAIDMNSIYFVPIKLEKSLNGNYFPRP